uniref:Uncharacterized protein n=1 Tax=viral metagenome TaxID=1070528 RepID=A0A6C0DQS0_9ZZZZ
MAEKIDVEEIFKNATSDPTVFSTMDIQKLLESIENVKNDYLENKTMDSVTKEMRDAIHELKYPFEIEKIIVDRLMGYRLVEEVNELHMGKYIRWIRRPKYKHDINELTNGAIVTSVKFTDSGVIVGCKNGGNRFLQIKFDDCVIFQKMTTEEQLILMAYERLDIIEKY